MTGSGRQRRSFLSALSWLTGLTAMQAGGGRAAAQTPDTPGFDLTWLDELKGQHMQVFDLGDGDPTAQPAPLRLPRNYMNTFRDVYKAEFPQVRTIVGISGGRAFGVNASDRLWATYKLGEFFQIADPATKQPSARNIFLDEPTLGVKALQARGTIFWQCAIALGGMAQQVANARQLPAAEVRADFQAGLNPGVRLVPSHVMALGLVQERRVTYVKV